MNLSESLKIEEKYSLNSLNIDGYHYWTLFRFSIIQTMHGAVDKTGKPHHAEPESFGRKLNAVLKRMVNIINPLYYSSKHADFLFVSSGRRVLNDGKYENTICDLLMGEYESSTLLEYSIGGEHLKPAKSKSIYYHDRIGLSAGLSGEINHLLNKTQYNKIYTEISSHLSQPIKELFEAYGASINIDRFYGQMTDFYYQYRVYRKKYRKLLENIRPKVIIMIVSYDSPKMVITEIAKEMNIPVIELQHGTCGKEHPGYNYPPNVCPKEFPDYYLSFSDFWRNQALFPIPAAKRISVGSPFSERRANELMSSVPNDVNERKMILFLSQPERGENFSKLAASFQNMIDTDKYKIVFKMHPTEHQGWKKRYSELAASDVEVVDNTNSDLYYLLSRASYIVAVGNSTALFEALLFKAPIFVHYPESMEEYRKLADMGIVVRFDTLEELHERICNYNPSNYNNVSFWETDSLNKMKNVIDEIAN